MLGATGWGSFHIRLRRRAGHTTSHHNTIRTASVTVSHEPVVGSRILWLLASVTTPTAHAPLRHGSGYSAEALGAGHTQHTHTCSHLIMAAEPVRGTCSDSQARMPAQHILLAAAQHQRFEIYSSPHIAGTPLHAPSHRE